MNIAALIILIIVILILIGFGIWLYEHDKHKEEINTTPPTPTPTPTVAPTPTLTPASKKYDQGKYLMIRTNQMYDGKYLYLAPGSFGAVSNIKFCPADQVNTEWFEYSKATQGLQFTNSGDCYSIGSDNKTSTLVSCNTNDSSQKIIFDNNSVKSSNGLCLQIGDEDSGCYNASFVTCDPSNSNQQFSLTKAPQTFYLASNGYYVGNLSPKASVTSNISEASIFITQDVNNSNIIVNTDSPYGCLFQTQTGDIVSDVCPTDPSSSNPVLLNQDLTIRAFGSSNNCLLIQGGQIISGDCGSSDAIKATQLQNI